MLQNNEKYKIEDVEVSSYPWCCEFVKSAPCILASLYKTLQQTLEQTGFDNNARHILKDLLIGMLKFPVLTILSQAYEESSVKERFSSVLLDFVYKYGNKTDGKWLSAAKNILVLAGERTNLVVRILDEVVELFETNNVVTWRNMISHGSSVMRENDVTEFKMLLFKVLEHFQHNQKNYCRMKLFLMDGKKRIDLNGTDNTERLNCTGKNLFLEIGGKTFPMLPLIINLNNEICYYDTFIKERRSVQYALCSGKGKIFKKNEKFWQIYLGLNKMVRHAATEESAEDDIFIREQMEEAEEIAKPDYLIRFQHIIEQLALWHHQYTKGVFLLQMEDGMGKTTIVKSLDGLINGETYKISTNSGKREHEIISCRAFYVNSVYAFNPSFFVQELTDSLRKSDWPSVKTLTGVFPSVDVAGPSAKPQMAELINRLTESRKKKFGINCQFIFVDGIDEIPNLESDKTILSILPEKDMLDDDIYIVLTSRPNNMLSLYTRHILEPIRFEEVWCENHDSPAYVRELKAGIMRRIKTEAIAEKIIELSGGRALGVIPLVTLVELKGQEILEGLTGDLFEIFRLEYIDRYYDKILSIAVTLAATPVPLTIGQLSALQDNPAITFSFLGYINELKSVTDMQNTTVGRLLIISRPEVRERLKKENIILDRLISSWQQALKDYLNVLQKENEDLDEFVEDTYLLRCILVLEFFLTSQRRQKIAFTGLEDYLGKFLINYISHRSGRLNWWEMLLVQTVVKRLIVILYKRNKEFGLRFSFQLERALLFASEQLLEIGDVETAKEVLQSILAEYEQFSAKRKEISGIIRAYSNLGRLFMMEQEPENAAKCFKKQNELLNQVRNKFKKGGIPEEELRKLLFDWDPLLNEMTFEKNYERISSAIKKGIIIENQLSAFLKSHPQYESDLTLASRRIRFYKTMGNIYKKNISDEKAADYFEKLRRLLDLIKPMFPEKDFRPVEYDYYLNIGQLFRNADKPEEARKAYLKSLRIIQELKINGKEIMSGYEARVLNSLSNLSLDRKDYEEVKVYAEQAITALEEEKKVGKAMDQNMYANLCGNLAEVYDSNGDKNKAEVYRNKSQKFSKKRTDFIGKKIDNNPAIQIDDTVLVKSAGDLKDNGKIYLVVEDFVKKETGFKCVCTFETYIPGRTVNEIQRKKNKGVDVLVGKCFSTGKLKEIPRPYIQLDKKDIIKRISDLKNIEEGTRIELIKKLDTLSKNMIIVGDGTEVGINFEDNMRKISEFMMGVGDETIPWEYTAEICGVKPFKTESDAKERTLSLKKDMPAFVEGGYFSWCYDYGTEKSCFPILKTPEIFIPNYKGIGMVLVVNMDHENDPKAAAVPMVVIGINEIRNRIRKITELDDSLKKDILLKFENTEDNKVVIGISKGSKAEADLAEHIREYLNGADELNVYWDKKMVINFMKINHFIE